jgi:hypothetical protein
VDHGWEKGPWPLGVPERTDRDDVARVGIVDVGRETAEVESTQAGDLSSTVKGSGARQEGEESDRLFYLIRENFNRPAVFDPPTLCGTKLFARQVGENDLSAFHSDRSSRRTSLTSIIRPSLTSSSEAASARCRADLSSLLSQSPGSKGSSSISVPSGRSDGSSTINRPFRTRALRVMFNNIPESGASDNHVLVGLPDLPPNYRMQQPVRPVTSVAGQRPRPAVPQLTRGR